jgi:hypothetical protein
VTLLFTHTQRAYTYNPEFLNPDKLYLLAIHPTNYSELARVEITNEFYQQEVIQALYDYSLAIEFLPKIEKPACFYPRHGIRAVKGARSSTVLVCFECRGQSGFNLEPRGLSWRKERLNEYQTNAILDHTLNKHGIRIKYDRPFSEEPNAHLPTVDSPELLTPQKQEN